jgi:hypothetical protein
VSRAGLVLKDGRPRTGSPADGDPGMRPPGAPLLGESGNKPERQVPGKEDFLLFIYFYKGGKKAICPEEAYPAGRISPVAPDLAGSIPPWPKEEFCKRGFHEVILNPPLPNYDTYHWLRRSPAWREMSAPGPEFAAVGKVFLA